MTVSVVIPTFNRARLVVRAVESALDQRGVETEVIVVDDGSTDDTERALKPFADRIRYIKQENRGVVAARNRGMELAAKPFIALLDSDDTWLPWKLALQLRCFELFPELMLTWTNCFEVDGTGAVLQSDFLRKYQAAAYRHFTDSDLFQRVVSIDCPAAPEGTTVDLKIGRMASPLFMGNLIVTPTAVFRREALSVGMFDPEMGQAGEDYDLFWRMADLGPFGLADVPAMYFRRGGSDHLHTARRQMAVSNLKAIAKYHKRHPQGPALNERLVATRMTEAHAWVATAAFDDGRVREARRHAVAAALRGSRQPRVYIYLLLSLLPRRVTSIARWTVHRLKGLRRGGAPAATIAEAAPGARS
ncbi:MAG TPA: glycosyltransferase [Alphaproteobacteria bacterium]|nr:glycosyltransferase [Alphaproteobacteria bacterium]